MGTGLGRWGERKGVMGCWGVPGSSDGLLGGRGRVMGCWGTQMSRESLVYLRQGDC